MTNISVDLYSLAVGIQSKIEKEAQETTPGNKRNNLLLIGSSLRNSIESFKEGIETKEEFVFNFKYEIGRARKHGVNIQI